MPIALRIQQIIYGYKKREDFIVSPMLDRASPNALNPIGKEE